MSFTHTIALNWTGGGLNVTQNIVKTGDSEQNVDAAVQAGQTDVLCDVDFLTADLESVYILSDQDVTLETNDGAAPDDTISLRAGVPLDWRRGGYHSNPFTANVSAFYFTNAGASGATVKIRILSNVTSSSSSSSSSA